MRKRPAASLAIFILILASFDQSALGAMDDDCAEDETNATYSYKIVNIFPHDKSAFTQGLVYDGKVLYEGTGLYGCSTLRQVELETGRIIKAYRLPSEFFGEGVAVCKDRIIQLTWQSMIGLVYEKGSLAPIGQFSYPREGWGITNDGIRLIASDGSDVLYFLDPDTFQDMGSVQVKHKGLPVFGLNELEYIKGEIYANIWLTSKIAVISPFSGEVTGWIDLRALVEREQDKMSINVLNGIAYDSERDLIFVTGKYWPELFVIKLLAKAKSDST